MIRYRPNATPRGHAGDSTPAPAISVIMPVHNGGQFIPRSIPPLLAMQRSGEVLEVIVVDDGSSDVSASIAADLGARVIRTGAQLGPAAARNRAAREAKGDLLWFVDADVVVHEDAARQLQFGFTEPDVAVFGAYDDRPAASNFLSQYKNLVHHFHHRRGRREASTFWSGCGAVRKEAFWKVGGFDPAWRCAEDIELGYRLRAAGGGIALWPGLQGTHLKEWRLINLLRTEIFCRALPWSRLLLTRGFVDDLNVGRAERLRAGLALAFLVSVVIGIAMPPLIAVPCVLFAAAIIANADLYRLFYRRKGVLFALAATAFHQIYYAYSSAAFAWSYVEVRVLQRHKQG